ncbi:MAG: hypothetical protein OEV55_05670 [candidate division Zixibacteria bacterium]|nr:hypothetical protein [candidate division Zixibacteria bacterium]
MLSYLLYIFCCRFSDTIETFSIGKQSPTPISTIEVATWIIAIFTAIYAIVIIITMVYISKQLRESKFLREATVLKQAYDYVIRTHNHRKLIFSNRDKIAEIKEENDLRNLESSYPEIYKAIHSVANCYHYLGFLMKFRLLTKKSAIFEEGGETILSIYEIIYSVIKLEGDMTGRENYKRYFKYLVEELCNYREST